MAKTGTIALKIEPAFRLRRWQQEGAKLTTLDTLGDFESFMDRAAIEYPPGGECEEGKGVSPSFWLGSLEW